MTIERTYNVPLRKGFINQARYKKAKKAGTVLKDFIAKHMKTSVDKVLVGKHLNEEIWKHGIKNPPHHVKITVIKEDDGTVKAELIGFKYEHKKKEQKQKETEKKEEKTIEESKKEAEIKKIKEELKAAKSKKAETKEEKDSEEPAEKKPKKSAKAE